MARRPLVKVCCIASLAEAGLAQAHGASALGLVSAMPSGPGVTPEQLIAEIAGALPAVDTFLLTALRNAEDLAAQHRRCRTRTLQLVDRVDAVELRKLRGLLPAVRLVQVVHVQGPRSVDEALAVAPLVDALLLDSGNPALERKELGGTGRTHDWLLSRRIREEAGRPVWLAGGLHPGNVAEAVACVEPHGVDVCSGLRRGGVLDPGLLAAFFAALPA